MFIDVFATLVVVMILYFGVDMGTYGLWIMAGAGIGTFLVTHWITSLISNSVSNATIGLGTNSLDRNQSTFKKYLNWAVVLACIIATPIGIYFAITYQPPPHVEPLSLMNGKYPLPKGFIISGNKVIMQGDTSEYPVASTEEESHRILKETLANPKIDVQKQSADYYYSLGMKYYTYAKEGTKGWDKSACFAFARNNFIISAGLPSDGTIYIESQTALLDSIHELQLIK